MSKKEKTYAEAFDRLQQIVNQIDANELDIDQLTLRIKEAKELIAFCSGKLTHVDKEIEILLADAAESEK